MSDEIKPSFFKLLSNMDFTKLLRLPPGFFTRHELTLPEVVKLRVHSGRTWSVKVERLHNGHFCFTKGWQFFARDVALQLGEFLVFTQLTRSKFDVAIYGITSCEREIPNIKVRNDVISSRGDNPLYFEICFKKHHRGRISLPARFSLASGVIERKEVTVEYLPSHDRKSVAVDHRKNSSRNRVDLAAGWSEFGVMNGLTVGNTYSFEFNPNLNLIYVNKLSN